MKYVINGGISTTTVPSYTRDALLLALQNKSLAGVALNLFLTRDNEIVVYSTPTVDHGKEYIRDLTFANLERRNFGERVRNHPILKFSDALKIMGKTNKMLVLNLDEQECPATLLKEMLKLTDNYPNMDIYVKTARMDIIDYLKNTCKKQRVGGIITKENQELWDLDLDFFSITNPKTNCDYNKIKAKLNDHRRVMLEAIDTKEEFDSVKEEVKDLSDVIYIITDSTSDLGSIIIANYQS